jgi:hypothetical protein
MLPAVALKVPVVLPAPTVTGLATGRSELLLERETAVPPAGAALEMVTVQDVLAPDARLVGLQTSEEMVAELTGGGLRITMADWAVPPYDAVIASV